MAPGSARMLDLRISHTRESSFGTFVEQQVSQPWGITKIDSLYKNIERLRSYANEERLQNDVHPGICAVIWNLFQLCYKKRYDLPQESDGLDPRVAIVDALMRDHLHDNLSVESMAAAVQLSRSQLSRLYTENMGMSPARRYRHLRLNRACELLKASTLSISQVAESCGFENANHFSRLFKQDRGESPTLYRQS